MPPQAGLRDRRNGRSNSAHPGRKSRVCLVGNLNTTYERRLSIRSKNRDSFAVIEGIARQSRRRARSLYALMIGGGAGKL